MNKREAENYVRLVERLKSWGLSLEEVDTLLHCERTLQRWAEEECNGTIQRDGDNGDSKPRRYYEDCMGEHHKGGIIPDREAGALKRIAKLCALHNLEFYHQSDPRGCALYISHPDCDKQNKIKFKDDYTKGVAVCL